MGSYKQFVENIGKGRVVPGYKNLLTDIDYCINLFENIETARTYTEMFYDFLAGERGKIDIKRFPIVLNNLKQVVEEGISLYTHLTFIIKDFELMQMFQESRPQPVTHSGEIRLHWGLINDLKFQFQQLVIAIKGIVIPDKTQPRHQQLFTRLHEMVSCYTNPNLKNRAKRYETTNTLYQTLNQNEILDLLKANHATVRELILTNDPNAGVPSIPVPQEVRGETIPTITTHRKVIPFILRIVYSGIKLKLVIAILFSSLILIRFVDR